MLPTKLAQEQQLLLDVQNNRQSPGLQSLIKLMTIRKEKAMNSLVTCSLDQVVAEQTKAQVYGKLIAEIENANPLNTGE